VDDHRWYRFERAAGEPPAGRYEVLRYAAAPDVEAVAGLREVPFDRSVRNGIEIGPITGTVSITQRASLDPWPERRSH